MKARSGLCQAERLPLNDAAPPRAVATDRGIQGVEREEQRQATLPQDCGWRREWPGATNVVDQLSVELLDAARTGHFELGDPTVRKDRERERGDSTATLGDRPSWKRLFPAG